MRVQPITVEASHSGFLCLCFRSIRADHILKRCPLSIWLSSYHLSLSHSFSLLNMSFRYSIFRLNDDDTTLPKRPERYYPNPNAFINVVGPKTAAPAAVTTAGNVAAATASTILNFSSDPLCEPLLTLDVLCYSLGVQNAVNCPVSRRLNVSRMNEQGLSRYIFWTHSFCRGLC